MTQCGRWSVAVTVLAVGAATHTGCNDGISIAEEVAFFNDTLMKSGNKQMLRSYHEAATSRPLLDCTRVVQGP